MDDWNGRTIIFLIDKPQADETKSFVDDQSQNKWSLQVKIAKWVIIKHIQLWKRRLKGLSLNEGLTVKFYQDKLDIQDWWDYMVWWYVTIFQNIGCWYQFNMLKLYGKVPIHDTTQPQKILFYQNHNLIKQIKNKIGYPKYHRPLFHTIKSQIPKKWDPWKSLQATPPPKY